MTLLFLYFDPVSHTGPLLQDFIHNEKLLSIYFRKFAHKGSHLMKKAYTYTAGCIMPGFLCAPVLVKVLVGNRQHI